MMSHIPVDETGDTSPQFAFGVHSGADSANVVQLPMSVMSDERRQVDQEKALPLPGWLVKVYFLFPIVLYVPDVIFNYFVYSDGLQSADSNPLVQASSIALWAFLSVGVVGMQWLLSVLAPWHWGQGHRLQAFFCGVGVIIATVITTWNSLSFRSTIFHDFPTDRWAYQYFPDLAAQRISLTMVLVALAPPFWGLFWAIVQPTNSRRNLRQLQEGHAEKLLRVQHEAELKRLRAEANAKVREAQLRGMAQTAAAARAQAGTLFARRPRDASQDMSPDAREREDEAGDAPRPVSLGGLRATPPGAPPDEDPTGAQSSQSQRGGRRGSPKPKVERARKTGLGHGVTPLEFGAAAPNTVVNPLQARGAPVEGVIPPGEQ